METKLTFQKLVVSFLLKRALMKILMSIATVNAKAPLRYHGNCCGWLSIELYDL